MRKKYYIILAIALCASALLWQDAQSKKIDFEDIDIQSVSDFDEDRIVFFHVEKDPDGIDPQAKDNSLENLLIIRDRRMVLMKSGYDNPEEVDLLYQQFRMASASVEWAPVEKFDIWPNKIKSEPNYMVLTDRRVPIIQKEKKEAGQAAGGGSGQAGTGYWELYNKLYALRSQFVKQHVTIYKSLVLNQRDSGLQVKRELIKYADDNKDKGTAGGGGEAKGGKKKLVPVYSTRVWAKNFDGHVYYAEDADGDGIVETFSVSINDSFHWGNNITPNILLISIKSAEAQKDPTKNEYLNQIKDMGKWAVEGLPADEKEFSEKAYTNNAINEKFNYELDNQGKPVMDADGKSLKRDKRKSVLLDGDEGSLDKRIGKYINEIYMFHPELKKFATENK